ncbi:extracellular solute-binding protein [Paenibacillus dakarensis]|uniref:extracellular solute-binding protein n=1 Tax=Paenibacillus dakarensis TaxID=1527293 RepID=UPI0006D559E5|nr:extracellular solute-binding protein [Paenibacillus dakarensis]
MRRKNYWFLFAILLLSLISLSPSFEFSKNVDNHSPGKDPLPPSQTLDTPESDLGPIQVAVQLNNDELEILKKMNDEFMKQTGAVVEIIPLESTRLNEEEFIQTMNLGEGPDILLVDSQWIKSLAVKGLLLPIDASQAVVPDSRLLGGLLPPVQWNGYQWGIPFDMDPYVLVWNMDDKQTKPPTSRKAWIEYKNKVNRPLFALDPEDPYAFAAAIRTLGGDPEYPDKEVLSLLAPPAGDTWLDLSNAEAVSTGLAKEEEENKEGEEDRSGGEEEEDKEEDKEEGALAVIGAYSAFGRELSDDTQLVLAGFQSEKEKPVVKSRSYAVTAQSESTSLAMNWITKMTSSDAEGVWSSTTGKVSALHSSIDSAINSEQKNDEVSEKTSLILEHKEAARLNFGRDDGFMPYSSSVSDLLHGRMTVKEFRAQYKDENSPAIN